MSDAVASRWLSRFWGFFDNITTTSKHNQSCVKQLLPHEKNIQKTLKQSPSISPPTMASSSFQNLRSFSYSQTEIGVPPIPVTSLAFRMPQSTPVLRDLSHFTILTETTSVSLRSYTSQHSGIAALARKALSKSPQFLEHLKELIDNGTTLGENTKLEEYFGDMENERLSLAFKTSQTAFEELAAAIVRFAGERTRFAVKMLSGEMIELLGNLHFVLERLLRCMEKQLAKDCVEGWIPILDMMKEARRILKPEVKNASGKRASNITV